MADNTLSILKPSVNNLSARIFVRAAGLDFEEIDVWGQQQSPEFMSKDPSMLTPLLECDGLPRGALWESCAIMQYLCNKHGLDQFYPTDPGERAMVDSAIAYHLATLYPLVARATYPDALVRPVRGRGRHLAGRVRRDEGEGPGRRAGRARGPARGLQHVLPRRQAVHRRRLTVDRRHPPGRDASSSCTPSTTTSRSGRSDFMARMESTLGDAYSEPAADVRGYIQYVKSPEAAAS